MLKAQTHSVTTSAGIVKIGFWRVRKSDVKPAHPIISTKELLGVDLPSVLRTYFSTQDLEVYETPTETDGVAAAAQDSLEGGDLASGARSRAKKSTMFSGNLPDQAFPSNQDPMIGMMRHFRQLWDDGAEPDDLLPDAPVLGFGQASGSHAAHDGAELEQLLRGMTAPIESQGSRNQGMWPSPAPMAGPATSGYGSGRYPGATGPMPLGAAMSFGGGAPPSSGVWRSGPAPGATTQFAPGLGPPGTTMGQLTQDQMFNMMMLHMMSRLQRDGPGSSTAGRSVRRMHSIKNQVYTAPEATIQAYLEEVKRKLGVEEHDPWQLWQMTGAIQWGRMQGMRRIHHHLGHVVALSLKGRRREAEAYGCQLLRSIHQSCLDGGGWETASLLLPGEDPVSKSGFAATEAQLEAICAFQETVKKLKSKKSSGDAEAGDEGAVPKEKGGGRPKK